MVYKHKYSTFSGVSTVRAGLVGAQAPAPSSASNYI